MKKRLLTDELRHRLIVNGTIGREVDHVPLARIFDPAGIAAWLLTELIGGGEGEADIVFGLCDLGFDRPELGYLSHSELEEVKGISVSAWSAIPPSRAALPSRFMRKKPVSAAALSKLRRPSSRQQGGFRNAELRADLSSARRGLWAVPADEAVEMTSRQCAGSGTHDPAKA